MSWLFALCLPPAIALAAMAVLKRSRWAQRLADHPNERSLHTQATPRLGGIAMMTGILPIAAALAPALDVAWAAAFGLALVSFADDLRSLPVFVRLGAHFAAAALAISLLAPAAFGSLVLAAALVLAIAWMTNLYNFMDGADGLAGGMTLIGFAAYALGAWRAGDAMLALGSATIASASIAFLVYNFPPARLFMGDAGSIPLGFLAGILGTYGVFTGAWPPWFPLLVFSPFAVDATVTLARRLARGEKIWIAHRQHCYQRLVLSGWNVRRLATVEYIVMLAAAASALVASAAGLAIQCAILVLWFAFYVVAIFTVEGMERSKAPRDEGAPPGLNG